MTTESMLLTHQISFNKVSNPATYWQVECLRSFDNVKIENISNSQLLKKLSYGAANDLIIAAKDNEQIEITR